MPDDTTTTPTTSDVDTDVQGTAVDKQESTSETTEATATEAGQEGTTGSTCTVTNDDGETTVIENCTSISPEQWQDLNDIQKLLKSIDEKTVKPSGETAVVEGTVQLAPEQYEVLSGHSQNIDVGLHFITAVFLPACVVVLLLWYFISRFWDMR